MSSRGTMGTEILPEERKKNCLFLRSTLPLKSSHRSLDLQLCLCCKGEQRKWHIPVSLTECLDPERIKCKEKLPATISFKNHFLFFLKHSFTTQFVPSEVELTAMLHHGNGRKRCEECFNLNERCLKKKKPKSLVIILITSSYRFLLAH